MSIQCDPSFDGVNWDNLSAYDPSLTADVRTYGFDHNMTQPASQFYVPTQDSYEAPDIITQSLEYHRAPETFDPAFNPWTQSSSSYYKPVPQSYPTSSASLVTSLPFDQDIWQTSTASSQDTYPTIETYCSNNLQVPNAEVTLLKAESPTLFSLADEAMEKAHLTPLIYPTKSLSKIGPIVRGAPVVPTFALVASVGTGGEEQLSAQILSADQIYAKSSTDVGRTVPNFDDLSGFNGEMVRETSQMVDRRARAETCTNKKRYRSRARVEDARAAKRITQEMVIAKTLECMERGTYVGQKEKSKEYSCRNPLCTKSYLSKHSLVAHEMKAGIGCDIAPSFLKAVICELSATAPVDGRRGSDVEELIRDILAVRMLMRNRKPRINSPLDLYLAQLTSSFEIPRLCKHPQIHARLSAPSEVSTSERQQILQDKKERDAASRDQYAPAQYHGSENRATSQSLSSSSVSRSPSLDEQAHNYDQGYPGQSGPIRRSRHPIALYAPYAQSEDRRRANFRPYDVSSDHQKIQPQTQEAQTDKDERSLTCARDTSSP